MSNFISAALEAALRQALGAPNVFAEGESDFIASHYGKDVAGHRRRISGVVMPRSVEEVQRVVAIANSFAPLEHVALYPISQGKNWGLGSKLPVRDGAIIVDLARMRRILEINDRFGYTVIEPGVTQQQLFDALRPFSARLFFNVTGSGTETSIIGNCLERGVGYLTTRAENLLNLEVVLGNGEIIRTGFGHYSLAHTQHLYKYGVGADLNGLFMQSNFGIVTRATFELNFIAEQHAAILCGLRDERYFDDFIDRLAELRRGGAIGTAFHIGNAERLRSTLIPKLSEQLLHRKGVTLQASQRLAEKILFQEMPNSWSALGSIQGSKLSIASTFRLVKQAMGRFGAVKLFTDTKLALIKRTCKQLSFLKRFAVKHQFVKAFEAVYGLTKGIPTDMPLKSLAAEGPNSTSNYLDIDDSDFGLMFVTPLIPMIGACVREVLELTRSVFSRHGFAAYITFNMCNAKTLEGVINLLFDRSNVQSVESAHRCVEELTQQFCLRGYIPYRVGIQGMPYIVNEQDSFWQLLKNMKTTLDPNNLIAPGRYNLI